MATEAPDHPSPATRPAPRPLAAWTDALERRARRGGGVMARRDAPDGLVRRPLSAHGRTDRPHRAPRLLRAAVSRELSEPGFSVRSRFLAERLLLDAVELGLRDRAAVEQLLSLGDLLRWILLRCNGLHVRVEVGLCRLHIGHLALA